jgi:endoplasmic reticulum-Golgi intermediate compartment protein 3
MHTTHNYLLGAEQQGVKHHVTKLELDETGRQLPAATDSQKPLETVGTTVGATVGSTVKSERALLGTDSELLSSSIKSSSSNKKGHKERSDAPCGNCLGAGEPQDCCNSCADVKAAYKRMGWSFDSSDVPQCQPDYIAPITTSTTDSTDTGKVAAAAVDQPETVTNRGITAKRGCALSGYIELSKARGNIHFAPSAAVVARMQEKLKAGSSSSSTGTNSNSNSVAAAAAAMDVLQWAYSSFNTSHTVNTLRFGSDVPGIEYPLEHQTRVIRDAFGMYQYYIKVVPTTYIPLRGAPITTNQYSVTEHLKHVEPGSNRGLPSVYLYYELSTITAQVVESRPGLFAFLTSVCAVVGGVYTVLGLLNQGISTVQRYSKLK